MTVTQDRKLDAAFRKINQLTASTRGGEFSVEYGEQGRNKSCRLK
jgi:hypothetical protein